MKSAFQIAIDGPVAAGKGTISRLLAQRLNFLYVDTGAMYRVAALLALRHQISWSAEDKIVELIKNTSLEMRNPKGAEEQDGRLTTIIVDGEDESWTIRTQKCSEGSSKVAVLAKVRQVLVEKQQQIAKRQNVIMEGRDITFRVLPEADLKIYLTASLESRAARRHLDYLTKGVDISLEEVTAEIAARDERDMNRSTDPLQITADAWVLDTSDLDIEEVVEVIAKRVEEICQTN
jgi:cytidylate kinase